MELLLETLQQEWAIRALVASTMVGLMCGILGCFIVLRNMALIGDALAHAILPGVVFAFMLVGYSILGFFLGAVVAGILTAVLITWIQHNVKTKNDAAIGIVFTAMFSIGVMAISWISRNNAVHLDLKDFLFGNVLGVANEDLYLSGAILLYVLLSIVVFYRYLFVTTFQPVIAQTMGISVKAIHYFLMLLLSFAVVASLRTVGVILVVAMLITPASTALLLSDRLRSVLIISGLLGMFSAVSGLIAAIWFETTPGPAMTVIATLVYVLAALFAPKRGLVFRYFHKYQLKEKIQLEDVLKQALKLHQKEQLNFPSLLDRIGFAKSTLVRHLKRLQNQGLVLYSGTQLELSSRGIEKANQLVRAHRLWETYLVQQMGLSEEQIHEEAEKYEHLLTEELLDEVDRTLGFPTTDPHGSPIPGKKGLLPEFPLIKLALRESAEIALQQMDQSITNQLWQMGLLPKTVFTLEKKERDYVEILIDGKKMKLTLDQAKRINIVNLSNS